MTDKEIFEAKAYFNKWLKDLTEHEVAIILAMMAEAREDESQYS